MNHDFALTMLLKPLFGAMFLGLWAGFLWLLWRFVPEGRLRRVLFFKLWADHDAWPHGQSLLSRLWYGKRSPAPESYAPPSPTASEQARRRSTRPRRRLP
ncbi:hypothetical protein GCM10027084_02220 [Pseudoxanthomonas sangjuensis]|uniref:hypothetical protein n=1 Tax=Pseudoxanthomonas sangjuensis TaxID=1503750 RepID=UPI0013915A26|nr:hypothetical protein [Pseudoxanthomonas sangjuensis]KAF1713893.1 hypothetical protein CSC71_05815 [Pseudoxanthomonas sangjuensis]